MKLYSCIGAIFALLVGLISCQESNVSSSDRLPVEIDTSLLKRAIETLASDEFEGRKPFTPGDEKTVTYLRSQFESMGLLPGNKGSFFQEVPLVEIKGDPDTTLLIEGPNGKEEFKLSDDFVTFTQRIAEEVKLEDSELVFCGYGIVAPEYGWNDYEGIDMRGKTAVVLVNDPGFDGTDSIFFKGNTMTYYGRWTYKYEEAARQGAAGCLIIH